MRTLKAVKIAGIILLAGAIGSWAKPADVVLPGTAPAHDLKTLSKADMDALVSLASSLHEKGKHELTRGFFTQHEFKVFGALQPDGSLKLERIRLFWFVRESDQYGWPAWAMDIQADGTVQCSSGHVGDDLSVNLAPARIEALTADTQQSFSEELDLWIAEANRRAPKTKVKAADPCNPGWFKNIQPGCPD